MPEPEKFVREPPEIEISDASKSLEGSEIEKLINAVSPAEIEEVSEEREIEGGWVSIVRVRELSGSAPSVLRFPAESEKVEEEIEITPSDVLLALGVNVAE